MSETKLDILNLKIRKVRRSEGKPSAVRNQMKLVIRIIHIKSLKEKEDMPLSLINNLCNIGRVFVSLVRKIIIYYKQ